MQSSHIDTTLAPENLSYEDIRLKIRNGDVLMYKGRSFASRVIRIITRSAYSHAGLAVWWNERLMVMEAVGKGVIVTPLSANVAHYHGNVEWFSSVEEVSEEERKRLVTFAQQELGKEYATWKAIVIGIFLLFKQDVEKKDKLRREKKLFCSHYVAEAYNAIGRDLKKGLSDRFMSPADVADSPLLKRRGILRKNAPPLPHPAHSHAG
jgi:hypothetical protein